MIGKESFTGERSLTGGEDDQVSNFFNGNSFYIFGDIDDSIPEKIISPLIMKIEEFSKLRNPPAIEIYISSDGGYTYFAMDIVALFEIARARGVRIVTIVPSHAFSAASMIAAAGHHRVVGPNAAHLIHYSRSHDFSHNPIMADRNNDHRKHIDRTLIEFYEKYTKLKDLEKLLTADNYMINGWKELKKLGLADEVIV